MLLRTVVVIWNGKQSELRSKKTLSLKLFLRSACIVQNCSGVNRPYALKIMEVSVFSR